MCMLRAQEDINTFHTPALFVRVRWHMQPSEGHDSVWRLGADNHEDMLQFFLSVVKCDDARRSGVLNQKHVYK